MANIKNPQFYINRELSWLMFNTRVLKQAQNESLPLLERLKFLAIYGTNLDEFYMIRVAGLKKLYSTGVIVSGADKLTPMSQLKEIREYLHQESQVVEYTLDDILKKLQKEGIYVKPYKEVSNIQKSKLNDYFFANIYPVVVPIAVDATHPFPHLNNLSFGVILKLREHTSGAEHYGLIRIPRVISRFIEIETGVYVPIGSLVVEHVKDLFPGHELLKFAPFRVTRNADIEIAEEEADDFMEVLEEGLKLRKKGELVRLELSINPDEDLIKFFNRHTNIDPEDIYHYHTFINLGSFWQIVGNKNFAHLVLPSHNPKQIPPLGKNKSIFSVLDEKEVMMYHPYESFEPIVTMIQEAAKDPKCVSIKMTLYRAGTNSPIVKSLMDAADEGKQVTVMVELKARFDEENNVQWAKALESAGAHVIYGVSGLKVHAKAALITRRNENGLKQYAHLGTGNYNPSTAKIYSDISFMTTDEQITSDLTKFFHFLTGFSKQGKLDDLFMSPTQIKPKILSLIQGESEKGSEGHIIAKVNSLVDADVIAALYKASQAGVKIELIIRGICCLKPGIEGVSENIRVVSIIGKYLEHARMFYFKHAEPNIYFSSADWMPRNLSRRIELMTSVKNTELAQKMLSILMLQLHDNTLAHELQNNGYYEKVKTDPENKVDSQTELEDYVNNIHKAIKKDARDEAHQLATRLFKES